MNTCRGITLSTREPCQNKARDINGFCGKHYSQSQKYAIEHPWSVISYFDEEKQKTVMVKVDGIVEGAFSTSQNMLTVNRPLEHDHTMWPK